MGVAHQQVTDRYAIYNCDSMELLKSLPDKSIHAAIYSPPFGGLYHYSSDLRDPANSPDYASFFDHYDYFVRELMRVVVPGRCIGVHASLVPSSNTGSDSYTDFPGDVIRAHQKQGWLFIARHVIWKEPLAVRNRTLAKNLAHRTIVEDGSMGGVAAQDELLVFRAPGAAIPVQHPQGLTGNYAGTEQPPPDIAGYRGWSGDQKMNRWSHWIWRRYASSVWDDIRLGHVLPFQADPDDEDAEKHVHPLQLDVIERFIDLRTMPGERVLTPFMGVGSEVYKAVQMGRYGIGAELKPTYYQQTLRNLDSVDIQDPTSQQNSLFDESDDDAAS